MCDLRGRGGGCGAERRRLQGRSPAAGGGSSGGDPLGGSPLAKRTRALPAASSSSLRTPFSWRDASRSSSSTWVPVPSLVSRAARPQPAERAKHLPGLRLRGVGKLAHGRAPERLDAQHEQDRRDDDVERPTRLHERLPPDEEQEEEREDPVGEPGPGEHGSEPATARAAAASVAGQPHADESHEPDRDRRPPTIPCFPGGRGQAACDVGRSWRRQAVALRNADATIRRAVK